MVKADTEIWKKIFAMSKMVNRMDSPLTSKILSNPNHPFVKTLVYIYSMESFVFKEINMASRNKDESKIKFYGPLASSISFILNSGNKKLTNLPPSFNLFRGLKLTQSEIED